MTAPAPARPLLTPGPLLLVFGGAVAVRVALAGGAGAASVRAGLVFAAVLVAFAIAAGLRATVTSRSVFVGLAFGALLVAPAAAHLGLTGAAPASLAASAFPAWAVVTAVVAGAEEAFLRGALFDAVARRRGTDLAIVVAAVVFALLHVPFYGWHVLPLDLAVGVVLGVARLAAGTWTAPAVAHVTADLAGWWLL